MNKIQHFNPTKFLLASCLMLFFSAALFAQESTEERKKKTMTIRITEDVDGEVTEKVIELPADVDFDLDETLRGLEIQEEIDELTGDQNMEIIIRKKELGEELKEMKVELERELGGLEIEINGEMIELQKRMEELHKQLENMPKRPLLGVHFEMSNQESSTKGAEVTKVVPGSGAEKAGLQKGDIITGVDGRTINNIEELPAIIGEYAPGDEVEISYLRDGKTEKTLATLGEGSPHMGGMKIMRFNGEDGEDMNFNFDFDFDFDDMEGHEFVWKQKGGCDEDMMKNLHKKMEMHMPHGTFLGIIPDMDFKKNGVRIEEPVKESTAMEMGLKAGDVITGINGNKISNLEELREELAKVEVGESYSVQFSRDKTDLEAVGTSKAHKGGHMMIIKGEDIDMDGEGHTMRKVIKIRIEVDELTEEEKEALSKANENFSPDNSLSPKTLKLYPNPNDGKFKLDLELEESSPVTFRVFDIKGNQVYMETIADFKAGLFTREVDITREAKGTYFLQITQNGKATTRKVITE